MDVTFRDQHRLKIHFVLNFIINLYTLTYTIYQSTLGYHKLQSSDKSYEMFSNTLKLFLNVFQLFYFILNSWNVMYMQNKDSHSLKYILF